MSTWHLFRDALMVAYMQVQAMKKYGKEVDEQVGAGVQRRCPASPTGSASSASRSCARPSRPRRSCRDPRNAAGKAVSQH